MSMTEDQWRTYLQSAGVMSEHVLSEEARTLAERYGSPEDVDRANGSGALDAAIARMIVRGTRPTASAGGVGGDADLDEDAIIDPGWYAFESDPGEFRFSRSSDPASVGLTARVPSEWAYWPSDMDRADYIKALERRWATLPGRPSGDLQISERYAWIESFIESQVARPVIEASGLAVTAFTPVFDEVPTIPLTTTPEWALPVERPRVDLIAQTPSLSASAGPTTIASPATQAPSVSAPAAPTAIAPPGPVPPVMTLAPRTAPESAPKSASSVLTDLVSGLAESFAPSVPRSSVPAPETFRVEPAPLEVQGESRNLILLAIGVAIVILVTR